METSVCEECRVNVKTKTHCREKKKHTEMPWDVTYVYVTLKKDLTVVEEVRNCKDDFTTARVRKSKKY